MSGPRSRFLAILLVFWPPLFWIVSLIWSRSDPSEFTVFNHEDGPVENTQVLVLAVAVFFSCAIARNLYSRNEKNWAAIYAFLALVIFFVAGEEIGWGQRMFGLATPDWFQRHNRQHETTIHNLRETSQVVSQLYNIVPVTLAVLSSLAPTLARTKREKWRAGLWLPPFVLLSGWLCCVSYRAMRTYHFATHPGLRQPPPILSKLQEPIELILYAGILAFVMIVWSRLRRQSTLSEN